jgi:hypothetical protein
MKGAGLYKRNIKLLYHYAGPKISTIFIPQVLNYKNLQETGPMSVCPYVKDRDLKKITGAYKRRKGGMY